MSFCKCGCGEIVVKNYKRGHGRKGKKTSQDHKEKIRATLKGRKLKPLSTETKLKISKKLTGRVFSENHKANLKEKITESWKNQTIRKRRIDGANKGKRFKGFSHTEKSRKKISKKLMGIKRNPFSESHKRKIALSARKTMLQKKSNSLKNGFEIQPNYSEKACVFFDFINKKLNLEGIHAKNKGEYKIEELRYWVDFYSSKYNLVIEWNDKKHYYNNKLTEKHKTRQSEIINFLNCKFINIKEQNFKEINVINKIKKYINNQNLLTLKEV